MYASPILLVGLGAFASQALAFSSTVIDTTIITITSCGPEVMNCPGKTVAPAVEVAETSIHCSVSATETAVATPAAPPVNFPVVFNSSRTFALASNLSTTAAPVSTPTETPGGFVVAPASFSNSTVPAPPLSSSPASIAVAIGTPTPPTTLTSVVVVPPPATSGSGRVTPASSPPTSAGDRMVVPGIMLGVLAFGTYLLG